MDIYNASLTLLSKKEIQGINDSGVGQLSVIKKYGTKAAITDLVILAEGFYSEDDFAPDDNTSKGRTGWYYTITPDGDKNIYAIDGQGCSNCIYRSFRRIGSIRPIIKSSVIFKQVFANRVKGYNECEEVEYGEYPQYAPEKKIQEELEYKYSKKELRTTGRTYTFDKNKIYSLQTFQPITYEEYEYQGKNYIRVKANSCCDNKRFKLSNGESYQNGDYVWVEVSPVVWLVDYKTKTLISKRGILSGILFLTANKTYKGNFNTTEMNNFLNTYMIKDLFQKKKKTHSDKEKYEILIKEILKISNDDSVKDKINKLINKYNYEIQKYNEEEEDNILHFSCPTTIKNQLIIDLELLKDEVLSNIKENEDIVMFLYELVEFKKFINNENVESTELINENEDIKKLINLFDKDRDKVINLINILLDKYINILEKNKVKNDKHLKENIVKSFYLEYSNTILSIYKMYQSNLIEENKDTFDNANKEINEYYTNLIQNIIDEIEKCNYNNKIKEKVTNILNSELDFKLKYYELLIILKEVYKELAKDTYKNRKVLIKTIEYI